MGSRERLDDAVSGCGSVWSRGNHTDNSGHPNYPNGFKCSAILLSTDVDYYSMIKDMWSKVGIVLTTVK